MGCDIHSHVEVKSKGKWELDVGEPFSQRHYGVFGFLTGTVRNYSAVKGITEKPRGVPEGSPFYDPTGTSGEAYWGDFHSHSYATLKELLGFDYDQKMEDLRVAKEVHPGCFDGSCTAEPGGGVMTTYRNFLGPQFFEDLEKLKELGEPEDVRVVFWFDN